MAVAEVRGLFVIWRRGSRPGGTGVFSLCGWNYKVPDGATRWRSVHGYDRRVFRRAAGFRAVTYEKAPALFGPGPVWMLSKGQAGGAWQGDKAPGI